VAVLRWVNLGLAVLLATLLVVELMRTPETAPPGSEIAQSAPVVFKEKPSRRARRMEAKMAIEEARRQRKERLRAPPGPVLLDETGRPIKD
jgi:hypothetical protein